MWEHMCIYECIEAGVHVCMYVDIIPAWMYGIQYTLLVVAKFCFYHAE